MEKINQAYADCEAPGTVDTVKHLSGLPINYLITVNFHGFQEIVDKIGGIWLDVDRRYFHVNNGTAAENYSNINLQPGYQLLNGAQALSFVRYRHTDDDYHRIARQQEFVRALKQQFARNMSFGQLLSSVPILTKNVEVGGKISDQAVLNWLVFAVGLPGGHFLQDKIEGVTGDSQTSTSTANLQQAFNSFTHPDVAVSKAANAAALNLKIKKKKTSAPPASKTTVLVLNGNGVAGSAASASSQLGQRGYLTVLPPGNLSPNAPTQGYFHTQIYYDKRQKGSEDAANSVAKLFVPSDVHPLPKDPKLRQLDPGVMVMVVVGETFHDQLVTQPPPAPVLDARGAERSQRSVGRARPAEADRAPGAVHAREPDGARGGLVPRRPVRRQAAAALLDRQEAPPEGRSARLQDRRRRVLGDRGDEHAEPARAR